MTERDLLEDGLRSLGLETDALVEPLERYLSELRLWNRRIDLLADAGEQLIPRHILDSLAPIPILRSRGVPAADGATIADLGSGAGLPGIPLAVALPTAHVTLVERSGRRAGFLRSAAAVLGLRNVAVQERRLEELGDERFDLLVFRALTTFDASLARAARRLTLHGGVLCAYQGRMDSAERMAGELHRVFESVEIAAVEVPYLHGERHIVLAS
ncbi:MAG: 16S rRNA (guanine(527)-N(7))-methyltransferase RsmG [Spirochaetes bacterium]|jgi:16S rRNA (guanine527-N7)-methyltransferase|nr:16S rRNA (guanine(527)-N(7))-methyltransferase RsmG [Spirochaetota bacterium]